MSAHRVGVSLLMVALGCLLAPARGAEDKAWATAPYKVAIQVAIDSSANPGTVTEDLARQLERQIHRILYPFWKSQLTLTQAAERTRLLGGLDTLPAGDDPETVADKFLYLTVQANADGSIRLASQELDALTGLWTPVLHREVRQDILLTQACWELLWDTFAPRAQVLVDPQEPDHAELSFQGHSLMPAENKLLLKKPGTVFKPYLVRNVRGSSATGKVIEVPWTYLVALQDDKQTEQVAIYSGSRRPFGARRRAGIDIIALELKPASLPTSVRFHASHDADQPLAGYEVFAKSALAAEFEPAGFTDEQGRITVRGDDYPVVLVALRSNRQPLVQVPVVPGAVGAVDIPVSDDSARLMVQETLSTFTEQMVDVVARRNILMARARDQLAHGNRQEAKELLDEISNLPTRANMDRFLARLERDPGSHSENPRVQAKIDRMFAESRKLMSTYLTTRELLELEAEVNSSDAASPAGE